MKELAQNVVMNKFLETILFEQLPEQTQAVFLVSTANLTQLTILVPKNNKERHILLFVKFSP